MNIEILQEIQSTIQSSLDRVKFEFKKALTNQTQRIEAIENILGIKESEKNMSCLKMLEHKVQELSVAKNQQNNEINSLNIQQKQLFDYFQQSELILKAQKPFTYSDAEKMLERNKMDVEKIKNEINCIKENVLNRQQTNQEIQHMIYKLEKEYVTIDKFNEKLNSLEQLITQKPFNQPKLVPNQMTPCFNNPSQFKMVQPQKFQSYGEVQNLQKTAQPCGQQLFFPMQGLQNNQEKQKQNITILETQKQ